MATDAAEGRLVLTPTATTVPTRTPVPLDWCDVVTPVVGERCRWPRPTPERTATPRPTYTPAPVPGCGAGVVGGSVCEWRDGETPMIVTPTAATSFESEVGS